ncbi:DUF3857 domain-containing protein [Paraburkholderia sp.]|uniref:DUF3857 domain-containing transglutaminase family protein n=1 Tax=Paraburkholderia sp. TaxID=1926495 RepID=UPI00238AD135|nr:DUF3857 domain-containing protein [Paraburkholderia sp.]MDE1184557.1 DUF3857 domain-containing protein [Paraburkholderia sp.]
MQSLSRRPLNRAASKTAISLCIAWLACQHASHATDASIDDPTPSTLESDTHLFVIQRDGSVEEHDDALLRANTASGIDDIAQRYVWFNKDIEQVQLVKAETIDPSGAVHPVSPDGIRDVQEPRSAGAPTFQDGVLRTVIFPGVGVGSRVRLEFRKTRIKPLQAGTFAYLVEPNRVPVEHQTLIFDLPADVPLYADTRGYVAREPVTENGRTRYTFDYRHGPYAALESGSTGYANWGDRLMVSTVPDYAAFAQRYRSAAVDPTMSDPAIVQLAQSLTANTSDPHDKARILYDWVRFNIRYVALFLGETAAIPHKATDILRNRYGDCKDVVALYGALLAAVGIGSEAVLLNLGPYYTLPSVPGYGTSAINHAIIWIPSLSQFADLTAGGVAFGYLPSSVMDRPVLLVDQGVIARTPAEQARRRSVRMQFDVNADGAASYAYRVVDGGVSAELERNVFRRATRQRAQQIAAGRLLLAGLHGSARISVDDVRATHGDFSTVMQGTIDHFVWPDGTTAVPAFSSLGGGIASQVAGWLAEPVRTQDWTCVGGEFDEASVFTFPANVRMTDFPRDVDVANPFFTYSARYVFDEHSRVLQVTRRFAARFGKQACSAGDFDAMRDGLVKVERDLDSQIVLKGR